MVPDFDLIQSEHRDYSQRQEDSHSHWTDGDQSAHVAVCHLVLERISKSPAQGTVVRWCPGGIEGVEAAI